MSCVTKVRVLAALISWSALAGACQSRNAGAVDQPADPPNSQETRDAALADIDKGRRNAIVVATERVEPAVVTVSVLRAQLVEGPVFPQEEFFFPFRQMRRRYWQRVQGLGSGVIIDPDGTVITNYHVVKGAQVIKITLPDGRELGATYLGGTELYDLAVLKLDTGGQTVPAAPLGDSSDLLIGEWVIAIGNPFGYLLDDSQPTVTVGVVSAKSRDVQVEMNQVTIYKDMIQTDAAINPGNSGGPLVNALGEVIGINTFILSRSGGNQGIGFAIPMNTVRRVMTEIKEHGALREVWVGVHVQEIPAALAESLDLETNAGVIVANVDKGSPADKAGIARGDVIRKIGNDTISDFEDAKRALYGMMAGDVVDVLVQRGNAAPTKTTLHLVERRE
ncbi:MAG TPA: trypsin-like peptidase domain-containing protein [bacterium]|nr:trypsin-like peptidase domain-containing protein [bacterium]